MKKLFYIVFILIPTYSISQINMEFENTYTVVSNYSNPEWGYLKAFNTHQGLFYYTVGNNATEITIYDQNHNFYKSVNISQNRILFITDKLFNDDDLIEFVCTGGQYGIQLINENGALLYEWSHRQDPRLFRDNEGNYKLVVYNQGPSPTYSVFSDVYALGGTLSVEQQQDIYLTDRFIGFPNPVENQFKISNGKSFPKDSTLEILTESGQKISERKISSLEKEITVDTSLLSSGVYIYKINGETHKFIKK